MDYHVSRMARRLLRRLSGAARRSEAERRALVRMARLLYPHDPLDDETYLEVLTPLFRRASRNPAVAAELRAGVAKLDALAGGNWLAAATQRQIEVLEWIEEETFFKSMRSIVRMRLYQHPSVWKLIGYEAFPEYEGYIHREFDDTDWLAEDPA